MNIQKPHNLRFKQKMIIVFVALALLLGGGLLYAYTQHVWPFSNPSATNKTAGNDQENSINYDPPTNQEIDEGQEAKKNNPTNEQPSTDKTPSQQKKVVDVGISYADIYSSNLEIRAFTNGIIEGTGTCTATVTMKNMESMRVTKSSKAFIDATSTVCEPIYIPTSQLHSGTWQVVVVFSSPDHEGKSETVEVKVP